MRRSPLASTPVPAPILGFALALATACAPRVAPRPAALPQAVRVTPVILSDGPEGESPAPGVVAPAAVKPARPARSSTASNPILATAVMVPSAHMAAAMDRLRDKELRIPVAGVSGDDLEDSFYEGRDKGERQHNALDILAPRNTPIVAADDGVILRLSTNTLGGITIYASDRERDFVYYYAHLDHYERKLAVGQAIRKGDVLGYVGTTGNAPKDVPHLHFQIMIWPTDGKWWDGEPVNPFPLLHSGASAHR